MVARRWRRAKRWSWEPRLACSVALPRARRRNGNDHLLRSRKFGWSNTKECTHFGDTTRFCVRKHIRASSSPNSRRSSSDTRRRSRPLPPNQGRRRRTDCHCCYRSRTPTGPPTLRRKSRLSLVPRWKLTTPCSEFTQRTRNRAVRKSPSGSTPDEFRFEDPLPLRIRSTAESASREVHSVSPRAHRGSIAQCAPDGAR